MTFDPSIRILKASEQDSMAWQDIPTEPGETTEPGAEVVSFRSGDGAFSFGLWRRAPETGPMEPPYHEIAVLIEGEVELIEEDGTVHRAGPGDVIVTPKGSKATWKALSPVKKFWAVYQEP
jgi:uncharacterized cupin superfamily protein